MLLFYSQCLFRITHILTFFWSSFIMASQTFHLDNYFAAWSISFWRGMSIRKWDMFPCLKTLCSTKLNFENRKAHRKKSRADHSQLKTCDQSTNKNNNPNKSASTVISPLISVSPVVKLFFADLDPGTREFLGCSEVRPWHFHCSVLGLIPSWWTKIPQALWLGQKKHKKKKPTKKKPPNPTTKTLESQYFKM